MSSRRQLIADFPQIRIKSNSNLKTQWHNINMIFHYIICTSKKYQGENVNFIIIYLNINILIIVRLKIIMTIHYCFENKRLYCFGVNITLHKLYYQGSFSYVLHIIIILYKPKSPELRKMKRVIFKVCIEKCYFCW